MAFLKRLFFVLVILHFDSCAASTATNGSYLATARRLYDYLMKDYRSTIRPANNSKETVAVEMTLSTLSIDCLDEEHQTFKIGAYMYQAWKDFGLVWNPKDFDNLDYIHVSLDDVWYPDLSIYNSKDAYYYPPTHHLAHVRSNGEVFWIPPVNIETHCELDMSDFPFDEHICKVVFGSWVYSILELNLTSRNLDMDYEKMLRPGMENLQWKLVKVTVERNDIRYPCCEEIYPDITYNFTVRRRSTFATHLFVGPSVMLCLVTPAVFLLPPGSGEKMLFGMGILIADTLLLGELINYMPTAHPNLPFIAKYFLANIVLASLSLAISAIIVGFWDKSTTRLTGPPAFFRLLVLSPVATLLCVKKEDTFSTDDAFNGGPLEINPEGEDGTESTPGVDPGADKKRRFMTNYLRNVAKSEWRQLAVVFDRLFFLIYCVILAILTLSFARYI